MIIGFYTETDKKKYAGMPATWTVQTSARNHCPQPDQETERRDKDDAGGREEKRKLDGRSNTKLQWTVVGSRTHTRGD